MDLCGCGRIARFILGKNKEDSCNRFGRCSEHLFSVAQTIDRSFVVASWGYEFQSKLMEHPKVHSTYLQSHVDNLSELLYTIENIKGDR